MAKVIAVSISSHKGTIKTPVEVIDLKPGHGIQGDAHAGPWHRQVSLLDQSSVDKMLQQGAKGLMPGIFAENITTEGLEFGLLQLGVKVQIGDCLLEVTQIGKECHQHCQIYQQVGMCIMPTEGVFTRVLAGGQIRAGDVITIIPRFRAAIITMSDKAFAGQRADASGPAIAKVLQDRVQVTHQIVLSDDQEGLESTLRKLCDKSEADVIFTTGGTGFSPRDHTPEATLAVSERLVPGITEAMRAASLKITPRAMLSRATAGIRGKTLIINLPGSPKAAVECLEVFLPVMAHALETLVGETVECAPPSEQIAQ